MYAVILGWIQLVRLCLSNKPEWVEGRKDLENYYQGQIKEPFIAGYNGELRQIKPTKPRLFGSFWITCAIAAGSTLLVLMLSKLIFPGLWR